MRNRKMRHVFIASKKAAWVVFTSLAVGLTGVAHAQSATSGKDTSGASGSGAMDNPTRGGTEKSWAAAGAAVREVGRRVVPQFNAATR